MKKSIITLIALLLLSSPLFAAAAFAQALDKDGNAVTWTFAFEDGKNVAKAKANAIKQLKEQGHINAKAAASTTLNQGHFAVLYAAYWVNGVLKSSYAFGFSSKSVEDAKSQALKELKKIKAWNEDQGYTVNKTGSF